MVLRQLNFSFLAEQDQLQFGRTVDDDASLFTIYFTVANPGCRCIPVADGETIFLPTLNVVGGAGGTVEASTTPGLITIGGEVDLPVNDGSDSRQWNGGHWRQNTSPTDNQAPTLTLLDPSRHHSRSRRNVLAGPGATATDTDDDNATLTSAIVVTVNVNEDVLQPPTR